MARYSVAMICLLLLTGCETLGYYSQAAAGQWSLWWQREPIEDLLADKATDPQLKQRLQQILIMRDFASSDLALPDNKSYRYYTALEQPYVVWNVFAAPEFSTTAMQWCFPIAGCVSYRGYFSEQAARQYAEKMTAQGYDTYVGGVAAYSTLGWFADPVLSTFMGRDDVRLAALLFHELAHQQVYLPGDTQFNESFATAVEIEGVKRWLASIDAEPLLAGYLQHRAIQQDFVSTMLAARENLEALYQYDVTDDNKRQAKQQLLHRIVAKDYARFQLRWGGLSDYDRWVNTDLNNAKLLTLASYNQWLPAFQQLLDMQANDLPRFYQRVAELAALDSEQRRNQLQALMP
ncbi:aminopeptidase [Oceanicoccus sagamiensis]|nr:aminopeptidase [Oceanicoccus sagamiensis]